MKNWSLSRKIWSVIGLLSFAFVCSSIFSLNELTKSRDSLNEITKILVKRDQLTSEIKDNQRRIVTLTYEGILRSDAETIRKKTETFKEVVAKAESDLRTYNDIGSPEGKAIAIKYLKEYKIVIAAARQALELGAKNQNDEATNVIFGVDSNVGTMKEYLDEMNDLTSQRLKAVSVETNANASRAIVLTVLISSVSILISLLISFFVLRSLTRAIAGIVKNLSDSSTQVSSASTQIASASEELSQATTEQAASLEETAASVEEMNSMVAKNSENASSAASTSTKSQDAVTQGKRVIEKMIESMEAINKSSEGMAEVVKVIEQIDKKTKVINEIVNKTELLSFNASVEAARAGEHGKGFAVVAEEVGNLARMSGSAAEEIATLLEESIGKVNQMVADTKKNVDTGAQVTRECGEVFEEVVQNVTSVSGMATEIASASQEQSRGCAEITKAMSQLDQMTQQNAATSEECASAAEELSAQAEALKNAVNHLVFTVNGENGGVSSYQDQIHAPTTATGAVTATAAAKSAPRNSATKNVVHLKSPKTGGHAPADPQLKRASGDAPHYDSDGFKDV